MSIAPITSAAAPSMSVAASSNTRFRRAPAPTPMSPESVTSARMAAVAELIERVTGRTVEFVPPMPYLTSGPVPLAPVTLEVVGKTERLPAPRPTPRADGDRGDTVQVDVSDVIDKGTSSRMLLTVDDAGGLSLHPELKVSL